MNTEPLRFLRSNKVYSALVGTVLALLPVLFAPPDLTREQKMQQWRDFTLAVAGLWSGVIVMQGVEGYAEKRDAPSPGQQAAAPTVQVNTNPDSPSVNVQGSPRAGV